MLLAIVAHGQTELSMTMTLRLLTGIQAMLMLLDAHNGRNTRLWERIERAERYLIDRFARNGTDEMRLILAPELGGEG